MIDIENLSEELIYFRAINKISMYDLATKMKISENTLRKIEKNDKNTKQTTKMYVAYKLKEIKKEMNNNE